MAAAHIMGEFSNDWRVLTGPAARAGAGAAMTRGAFGAATPACEEAR